MLHYANPRTASTRTAKQHCARKSFRGISPRMVCCATPCPAVACWSPLCNAPDFKSFPGFTRGWVLFCNAEQGYAIPDVTALRLALHNTAAKSLPPKIFRTSDANRRCQLSGQQSPKLRQGIFQLRFPHRIRLRMKSSNLSASCSGTSK